MKPAIQLSRATHAPGHLERLFDLHGLLTRPIPGGRVSLRFDEENHPLEISRRDMGLSGFTGSIGVSLLSDELAPYSSVVSAGARTVNLGITAGPQSLPAIDHENRGGWGAAPENVEPLTTLNGVTPRRVWATITTSGQLAAQSGLVGTEFVYRQILAALAGEIDRAALNGSGTGGQPLGLLADADIDEDSGNGEITLARLASMEKNIGDGFGEFAPLRLVAANDVREYMRYTPGFADGSISLWDAFGVPKSATPHLPGGKLIMGDFTQLVVPIWGTLDVLINPYSRDTEDMIRVTGTMYADVIALRPQSFTRATHTLPEP